MTDVRFYHLTTKPLESALPEILEKVVERGQRAVVKAPDDKTVKRLNDLLWTYRPESFLPHGTKAEGHGDKQPIWLTESDDNPNNADILILADGAVADDIADYAVCCEMLNGHDDAQVAAARQRWTQYKEQGHTLTYWQQDDKGRWHKKET